MRASAVYACVKVLAETIASLPLIVYRRLPNGGKERALEHPQYRLLHDQPNGWQTSFEWREMTQGHVTLRGMAYSEIIPGPRGAVEELIPLHPDRVEPKRLENGSLIYIHRPENGKERRLTQEEVFVLRGLSSDGIKGLSPIEHARESIGLSLATEGYGARFFQNDARPGGVLESPNKLDESAYKNLKTSWAEAYSGVANSHKPAILEQGLTWKQMGMTSEDAQFLETRKFQLSEIARIFRVPPHMIGDLERSTNNNIEHQSIEFVVHTIRPWLVRWEQAITRDLLIGAGEYFAEFLVDGLLRGDFKTRSEGYASAVTTGWMTPNEVREKENLNPIEGGDELMKPLNMAPGGEPPKKDNNDDAA